MKWDAAAVIAAVVAGVGYLRWFVRAEMRDGNADLLERINGTYVRSAGANVTGAEIERRLDHLEARRAKV